MNNGLVSVLDGINSSIVEGAAARIGSGEKSSRLLLRPPALKIAAALLSIVIIAGVLLLCSGDRIGTDVSSNNENEEEIRYVFPSDMFASYSSVLAPIPKGAFTKDMSASQVNDTVGVCGITELLVGYELKNAFAYYYPDNNLFEVHYNWVSSSGKDLSIIYDPAADIPYSVKDAYEELGKSPEIINGKTIFTNDVKQHYPLYFVYVVDGPEVYRISGSSKEIIEKVENCIVTNGIVFECLNIKVEGQ